MNGFDALNQAVSDFEGAVTTTDAAADAVTQSEIAHAQAEANVTTAKAALDAARADRDAKFQALKDAVTGADPNTPPATDSAGDDTVAGA